MMYGVALKFPKTEEFTELFIIIILLLSTDTESLVINISEIRYNIQSIHMVYTYTHGMKHFFN